MKTKCFKGIDFYDSEFKGFEYSDDRVWVWMQLWNFDEVLIEYIGVKFFSYVPWEDHTTPDLAPLLGPTLSTLKTKLTEQH